MESEPSSLMIKTWRVNIRDRKSAPSRVLEEGGFHNGLGFRV